MRTRRRSPRPGTWTPTTRPRDHAGLDRDRARIGAATCARPRRRGRARRARAGADRGGRARARRPAARRAAAATTRSPRSIRLYLLDHAHVDRPPAWSQLIDAIAAQASAHPDAIMPGRTHLQHAQPVLLAHHLLAHAWPLVRDLERLRDWRMRAAAVALRRRRARRAALGLDPALVARELGLAAPDANSIDGTAAGTSSPSSPSSPPDRRRPLALRGGRHPLGRRATSVSPACTTPTRPARRSCRRRRTPTSPSSRAASPAA